MFWYVATTVKHDPQFLNTYVQALGGATGLGREGWLLPGDRVAPRVVVAEHACQVNHRDLRLHDTQCVACSFLLSLVSLALALADPR